MQVIAGHRAVGQTEPRWAAQAVVRPVPTNCSQNGLPAAAATACCRMIWLAPPPMMRPSAMSSRSMAITGGRSTCMATGRSIRCRRVAVPGDVLLRNGGLDHGHLLVALQGLQQGHRVGGVDQVAVEVQVEAELSRYHLPHRLDAGVQVPAKASSSVSPTCSRGPPRPRTAAPSPPGPCRRTTRKWDSDRGPRDPAGRVPGPSRSSPPRRTGPSGRRSRARRSTAARRPPCPECGPRCLRGPGRGWLWGWSPPQPSTPLSRVSRHTCTTRQGEIQYLRVTVGVGFEGHVEMVELDTGNLHLGPPVILWVYFAGCIAPLLVI